MPKYRIKLSDGRTVTVEAAQPPSEQDVLSAMGGAPETPAEAPESAPERSWMDTIADAMPTIGGTVGGFVGKAPGLRTLSAGIGGAAGEGYRQLARHAGEIPGAIGDVASNMIRQPGATMKGFAQGARDGTQQALAAGGTQAAVQGVGEGVGIGLRTFGRGLYRAGALPLNQITKYGDMVGKGIENRVPVTKAGLAKAGRLKTTAQATKQAALGAADNTASIRTGQIAKEATDELAQGATATRRAGLPDQTGKIVDRASRFQRHNPSGLTPSEADAIKGTLDDRLGGAYQKIRQKQPLSSTEQADMAYKNAIGRGLEDTVPNFKGMNKDVMDAVGLQKMIGRRVNPGSGGNQGLENAMMIAGGPAALPARLLMLPGVASSAGIGAHVAGQKAPNVMSNMIRAAILAQLEQGE